jgi:hypothetical protein
LKNFEINAFQCDSTISWLNPLDELVPLFSLRYSNIAFLFKVNSS